MTKKIKKEDPKDLKGIAVPGVVFPSEEQTISVEDADGVYGGAHKYTVRECKGFHEGKTEYVDTTQTIQFIQKLEDGTITPGLQSEQIVLILLDRHRKLNHVFESEQYTKMLHGLNMFLEACRERVQERMDRGVMGELKK